MSRTGLAIWASEIAVDHRIEDRCRIAYQHSDQLGDLRLADVDEADQDDQYHDEKAGDHRQRDDHADKLLAHRSDGPSPGWSKCGGVGIERKAISMQRSTVFNAIM